MLFNHFSLRQRIVPKAGLIVCTIALLSVHSVVSGSEPELAPLEAVPSPPQLGHPITFLLRRQCNVDWVVVNHIALNTVENAVDISFRRGATDIDGLECGGDYGSHEIPFDGVTEPGKYRFNFYSEGFKADPANLFNPDRLGHSFDLYVQDEPITHRQEVPHEGARQSGVGLVRGWVCNAELVEVQFDEGQLQEVAYGSPRSDTRPICGDSDNGFSMALAWGNLGLGSHTMKTYIDSEEVSNVQFEVVGLSQPFMDGLSGSYILEDFPEDNQSVTIEWSEPDQNFLIIEHVVEE